MTSRTPRLSRFLSVAVLVAWAALCLPAGASGIEERDATAWRGSIGVGVLINDQPYRGVGADAIPVPILDLRYGRAYVQGLYAGFGLAQTERLTWTVFVRPDFTDLDPEEADVLDGMERHRMSWLAGTRASRSFGRYDVDLELAHDVSGEHDGGWVSAGVGRAFTIGRRTRIVPSLGARWDSAELLDTYYGVRPAEARADRPAYRAGSGVSVGADVLAIRRLTRRLGLVGRLSWERLPDAVAESPLVDARGKGVAIFGLTWTIGPGAVTATTGGRPSAD